METSLKMRPALDTKASTSSIATLNRSTTSSNNGLVVFSGGSAANSLVDVFRNVAASKKCQLSYVIPISDNGGSSSELIRMFGGPGNPIRHHLYRADY